MQDGGAEDAAAGLHEGLEVIEGDGFLRDGAGDTVEQVVDADGVEGFDGLGDLLQDVLLVGFRLVAGDAGGGVVQRAAVHVHQRHAWIDGGEVAVVEEVSGADADVEVIGRDLGIVLGLDPARGAFPDPLVGNAEHDEVIHLQRACCVDGLPCVDLFFGDGHRGLV